MKFLEEMKAAQPPRDKTKGESKRRIEIYPGDFNQSILNMLANDPISDREATFCLLDQRTFECDWASVRAIATHKKGGNKIELFYFFPERWINRAIKATTINKDAVLEKWWGNQSWPELLLTKGAVRALHISNRFKSEFSYKHANPFAIYEKPEKGGHLMYYMIHASDHDEAPVLMNRAYGKALDIEDAPEQLGWSVPISLRPKS